MTHQPRVFSGVQPTGALTLGNYLGAVKRFVELQEYFSEIVEQRRAEPREDLISALEKIVKELKTG